MLGRTRSLSLRLGSAGSGGPGSAALPPQSSYIVYRHLQDGDVMLTNRQPTLHKPGAAYHCCHL